MANQKGVRCIRKGPEMWPQKFHDAMKYAARGGSAPAGFYPTKKEAEAAARSMRRLWQRLAETPLHKSAQLLTKYSFKTHLMDMDGDGKGYWCLEVLRSESKNFTIRD